MGELSSLPNIGKVIEDRLNRAGIFTKEELIKTGIKDAFVRIKTIDPEACLSMLYAIGGAVDGVRGAVDGVRSFNLPEEKKTELKKFYNSL